MFTCHALVVHLGVIGLVASLAVIGSPSAAQCVEMDCVALRNYSVAPGLFGWAISELADADGDGTTDLITGAPFFGANAGRAWIISTADTPTPYLWTFTGTTNDQLGWAMADAGLVGAKGVPCAAVGAPSTGTSGLAGRVRFYSTIDGSLVRTLTGVAANDRFGYAVGNAGDINHDGRDELIIGAPFNDQAGANAGRAYIYSGLDGTLIRSLPGAGANHRFGSGVDGVGDVNGDGVPDQAVAAPAAPVPGASGRLYVYSGATGALLWFANANAGAFAYGEFFVGGVGDVNGDTIPDVYVGDYGHGGGAGRAYVYSGVNGSVIHTFAGAAGEGLGPGRFAGDINGDGYADLAIGAYTSSLGAANAGRVYIRSGRDGSILRTITSTVANEQRGFDAVGIGDINADGKIDFALSAANADRVYVFAGTTTALNLADVNDDGLVGIADLLEVIGAWGPCSNPLNCPADVAPPPSGDNSVGIADLLAVIGNWG